ncbi:MAG: dihydroorotate dehydrogenase electron transfer subunit [Candidatus Micrarchaeota archaeon]
MSNPDESSVPMQTTSVKRIIDENYRIKTFELGVSLPEAKPGQFAMVWVPHIGERPMSIGSGAPLSFTVAKVGPVSEALHKLKEGDLFSFRGPFGNGFNIGSKSYKKILLVGGGYGVVPLSFLAEAAKKKKFSVTAIIAARNASEIVLEKRLKKACKVIVATDDGSKGFKGNAVQAAKAENLSSFDCVFSCGPEKMMYFLALACKDAKVPCQLSLERQMKCGMGICGSCAMNGKLVCKDGPIFSGEEALGMKDFGK